jgi:ElaB/YqjD/DUF883 family membrane-anchored ribosome-binding protein
MAANTNDPTNLSEAIARLESATQNKSQELKNLLGSDYSEIRKALNDLKSHLGPVGEKIGEKVKEQVQDAKKNLETKVQDNPLVTLAIVGFVGLLLGWIFGNLRRRGD